MTHPRRLCKLYKCDPNYTLTNNSPMFTRVKCVNRVNSLHTRPNLEAQSEILKVPKSSTNQQSPFLFTAYFTHECLLYELCKSPSENKLFATPSSLIIIRVSIIDWFEFKFCGFQIYNEFHCYFLFLTLCFVGYDEHSWTTLISNLKWLFVSYLELFLTFHFYQHRIGQEKM